MKPNPSLRHFLAALGCTSLAVTSTSAQSTYYWENNTGTPANVNGWGDLTNWTTSPTVVNQHGPNPSPTAADIAFFNVSTLTTAQSVFLGADRSILGIIFNNANTTSIRANNSSTPNRTLNLGASGITINSGAGAVTLGDGGTNGQFLLNLTAGAQIWTNLSANNLTIDNTAATFTRAAGATLTFNQVGAGGFAIDTTELPNDATGIVGPWSFFGTGTSQQYAFNNAGSITGFSGGTAAADAEAFLSDTANYDFNTTGTTTLTADRTAHTARYTGTGNVIDLGPSANLTLNGLLAVGSSGALTIQRAGGTGTLAAGSGNDLLLAGTQDINISAPISGTSGSLAYAGSGTLTLSGANTYSGATTVGSGTVVVDGSSVLPTTTLVNIGNAVGTTFRINNNTTIGNIAGLGTAGTVALQGNTLTLGNSNNTTYNGRFTGTSESGIIKQGTGTLTLGVANSIPGTMSINQGTVLVPRGNFSGGTITLNGSPSSVATLDFRFTSGAAPAKGAAGLGGALISNPIVLGSSVTTTGARLFTSTGDGSWNFTGGITGAAGATQTLGLDTRSGGTTGGDRATTTFHGVIANGSGGSLSLSFNITPQSASSTANNHPSYVNIAGINTFTGTLTAFRNNAGATSFLTIGGEHWANGFFGNNTPTYGREGTGYLAGPSDDGNFTSAINFGGTAGNIVNLAYFSSANQTLSGVIGGSGANGALIKRGSGTLTLTAANGYNSLTTIGGGKLLLGFDTTTSNILPSATPLWMGLGVTYAPNTSFRALEMSGGGGGGILELGGAAASATQTVAGLTTAANTTSGIVLGANRTLSITSGTIQAGASHAIGSGAGSFPATISTGGASGLNFNTSAGGADAATSTIGTSIVQFGSSVTGLTNGFTVTDSSGFGLAAIDGSNRVIRDTTTPLLPTDSSSSTTNYRTTSSGGNSVTSSQSTASITTDTTGGNVTLSLDSGVTLSNNVWNFGAANGTNTAQVTGGDGVNSVAAGNTISINNFNAGAVTFNTPILANGTNALVVGGTGTVVLNGLNTFSGATTINSGNLQIGGSGQLVAGTYAGTISINAGSVLRYSSDQDQTLSGAISGSGGLTKDTSSSVLTLSGTNIYTGPTMVNAGTLRAGAAGGGQAFGGGSAVTLANTAGVVLNLNNFNQTIGSLAGGGTTGGNVSLGTATLTTGGNNASTTFGGVISSTSPTGGLTKNGSGTLTLTGANDYTGPTNVNAGTLALVGGSLTSAVTVASGASLGFTLGSPASNTSTVNLTNGTVKITGTPALASYTLITTGGITGTPVLDAPIAGYALVVDGTTLKLNSTASGTSYTAWKTTNSVTGDPDDDQDGDGVSNAIEFLLGGTTGANDLDKLPVAARVGTNMTFTFKRKAGILDGINSLVIEVDTDLNGWETSYTVGATTATSSPEVNISLGTPSGFDTITLSVPVGSDPKKFARLKLLVNP